MTDTKTPTAIPLSALLEIQHILERKAYQLKRAADEAAQDPEAQLFVYFNPELPAVYYSRDFGRSVSGLKRS